VNEQGTSRRRLLRGAAAGLAGGAAAVPGQAQAAVNDPVLLGAVNNSGRVPTLNSSAATDPTLTLVNPTGPTLQLEDPGLTMNLPPALGKGTFFSRSGYGDVQIEDTPSGLENKANWLYTDRIALMTLPVTPTRVLDTRTSSGRANIVYGAGSISSGRLGTNKLIVVRMDHLVSFEGVRMNVT
jgi:hypothetical protein